MSRQINLYHPRFLKRRDWLAAQSVFFFLLLALLLISIGAMAARWALARSQARAEAVNAELEVARARFAEMTRQMAAKKPDPVLAHEVARLQRHVAAAEQAKAVLADTTGGGPGTPPISQVMQAFAASAPQGLWLTVIGLGEGRKLNEIRGRMVDQALLAPYLTKLEAQPVFAGRSFAALDMKGAEWSPPAAPASAEGGQALPPPKRWYVEFSLRAEPAAPAKTPGGKP